MYQVKEAFYTLQGEGAQTGRASVFCRFAGCNLWSGREQDRASAACTFCDTDFVGTQGQNGGRFTTAAALAKHLAAQWPEASGGTPYVVFTGGEPLLQLDEALIEAMHERGFEVAVETNGTLPAPEGIDWLCVSPKGASALALTAGDELKLVYPQPEAPPERFTQLAFRHFFLQPMGTEALGSGSDHLGATLDYCLTHPRWRLSLQTHKITGID
ncbi:7-carboxy-7-deazaguanine synthase [Billgrantia kenyensis]|uniref:7-carboxy-7-deazaguanine synthase n=1 Tax=Billgrantia kenyensis TaxID=321266 RepID=A0A7W0ACU4_9GAMM|nr:7-carboxy-7-deazaguanine synthase [Halomonas kenyensis]MBA2777611.1 7-carboxy-7-deazaguanine synthase [Halomonas kenyensis]MCG6660281.1 7-carboxy-7-deazaguanine synthase [Halomonas kenyensis]